MRISLGFSPCPNDTFMFDALINQKIDTQGFEFIPKIADVEELNLSCLEGSLDISKMSYHAFTHMSSKYQMLTSGSALGRGVGPLLISKMTYNLHDVDHLRIAIPGKYTTAAFLLKDAFPEVRNLIITPFDTIEKMILEDEADAGLIIHENRFTYADKGLLKIIDLGEYWEQKTDLPIPLGGIAIKRDIQEDIKLKVNELIQQSVEFAFENPDSSADYVLKHAQEMEKEVLQKHIETYVNQFSSHIGLEGKKAVKRMFIERFPEDSSKFELEYLFVS